MKKVLVFQLTAGGATVIGTAGAIMTAIGDDNQVIAKTAYPISKPTAITKISCMGALVTAFQIQRSSHGSDPITLRPLADTQADLIQTFELEAAGLPGIALNALENLGVVMALSGAGTGLVYLELDDSYPSANYRGVVVAGSAAAVALGVPVETGANLTAGLVTTDRYTPVMANCRSTTADAFWLGVQKKGWILLGVMPVAECPGAPPKWLTPRQSALLASTGQELVQGSSVMISAFAADAANVQSINVLWKVN
jgi:hypothetical protein